MTISVIICGMCRRGCFDSMHIYNFLILTSQLTRYCTIRKKMVKIITTENSEFICKKKKIIKDAHFILEKKYGIVDNRKCIGFGNLRLIKLKLIRFGEVFGTPVRCDVGKEGGHRVLRDPNADRHRVRPHTTH